MTDTDDAAAAADSGFAAGAAGRDPGDVVPARGLADRLRPTAPIRLAA